MVNHKTISKLWLLSGTIFLILSLIDIIFPSKKASFIITLEIVATVCFLSLSFVQWKKHKSGESV